MRTRPATSWTRCSPRRKPTLDAARSSRSAADTLKIQTVKLEGVASAFVTQLETLWTRKPA